MNILGVEHVVYNTLRDLPGRYSLCTHSLTQLYLSDILKVYRYVQRVHKNSVQCRLFAINWGTAVIDIKLVHLVYEALRDLPIWYYLCTHILSVLFSSDFGKLYRFGQQVCKIPVHCRLSYTVR